MVPIAREVRPAMLVLGITTAIMHFQFGFQLVWPVWLAWLALLVLFRDFKRTIPALPLAVVSPVDGRVIDIKQSVYDPYLKRTAQAISLRQSLLGEFNVHSPVEGKVQNLWVRSSKWFTGSELALWVQTDEQDDAVMVANLDSILRHASCKINAGEKLGQGQRCGFIAFSCVVVIYLPSTAHIGIDAGQCVRAGSDQLAEFVHEAET